MVDGKPINIGMYLDISILYILLKSVQGVNGSILLLYLSIDSTVIIFYQLSIKFKKNEFQNVVNSIGKEKKI